MDEVALMPQCGNSQSRGGLRNGHVGNGDEIDDVISRGRLLTHLYTALVNDFKRM
jgi:hypothetical protein